MSEPAGSVLALDVGTKRIGIAVASLAARLASPLVTLENDEEFLSKLDTLVQQHDAREIIVGLPRNLDGNDTAQTAYSREFAADLEDKLPKLVVKLTDEAGTSVIAEEKLQQEGKPYTKADIDKYAACYILQSYLEEQ